MTKPTITADQLREILSYDPETGRLTRLVTTGTRSRAGQEPGWSNACGYREMKIDGRCYLAHRIVWLYVHGEWPAADIDHINGDRMDNRLANLRDVSRSVNCQNKKKARSDNSTGFLGVSRLGDEYVAQIFVNGRNIKIGQFETPEFSHQAYLAAKRQHHAGCTI
jgi:hypothetical protein